LDRRLAHLGAYRAVRPLVVGVVHGLAGSAAVALLVLGTIRDAGWAVAYLLVFGVGTVAGMLLITTALAMPVAYAARRFERLHRGLGLAAGVLSLAFGVFLFYQLGFVHGLFIGHPQWTPD
jgi:high-affinity nickel-transport protein